MNEIIVISDTHCKHEILDKYLKDKSFTAGVDIIIHCGDESNNKIPAINYHESVKFLEWYSELDFTYKLFVPGNHSTAIEQGLIKPKDFPEVEFLINRGFDIGINGKTFKFYGSPITPSFGINWAYNCKRSKIEKYWKEIPDNTDVLITHGPPHGILDITNQDYGIYQQVGL